MLHSSHSSYPSLHSLVRYLRQRKEVADYVTHQLLASLRFICSWVSGDRGLVPITCLEGVVLLSDTVLLAVLPWESLYQVEKI